MAKINIKQINNNPASEGGMIVYDGAKNTWSNISTSAILVPSGTISEQPVLPQNGHIRYNTDNNQFEFYENGIWRTFGSIVNINDLGDVDTVTSIPTNGQILSWNGTNWIPSSAQSLLVPFQRVAVTTPSYIISISDTFIGVQHSTVATSVISLPDSSMISIGHKISIKDEGGNSQINNITVIRSGTDTIDGDISFILSINFGAIHLQWTGFEWSII